VALLSVSSNGRSAICRFAGGRRSQPDESRNTSLNDPAAIGNEIDHLRNVPI
jgi:hypothetical protein